MAEQKRDGGIIPHMVLSNATQAIEFYKKAFGAIEEMRMPAPDQKRVMHCQLRINGAVLMLCDDFPEHRDGKPGTALALGGTPVYLHQNVPDCDAAIKRAADAGATVTMPAQDMFWGDRYGQVRDPFGNMWSFANPLAGKK